MSSNARTLHVLRQPPVGSATRRAEAWPALRETGSQPDVHFHPFTTPVQPIRTAILFRKFFLPDPGHVDVHLSLSQPSCRDTDGKAEGGLSAEEEGNPPASDRALERPDIFTFSSAFRTPLTVESSHNHTTSEV